MVSVFEPARVPARILERVTLRLDGYEALRLADYEGLQQEDSTVPTRGLPAS